MASGQAFSNVDAVHDVVYMMSIAGRFWYYYKINCASSISYVEIIPKRRN